MRGFLGWWSRWVARWRRVSGRAAVSSHATGDGMMATAHVAPGMGVAPMLDCESVMRQLWDYLDGELTPDRMVAIRAHVEMCTRCYPQCEFERSFLDAVATSAREHPALDSLRAKVGEALVARGLQQE